MEQKNLAPHPNQPKEDNFNYGKDIIKDFLFLNVFYVPRIEIDNTLDCKGCFEIGTADIKINLKKCKSPINVPGFSWSYTGYKSDITPAGVLAHEIGHFIDWRSNWKISNNFDWKKSKAVSSYEPNQQESFAETMRLFILNPNLLEQGSPDRYKFIINEVKLKPLILNSYEEILKLAHPSILAAAESWIDKKTILCQFT